MAGSPTGPEHNQVRVPLVEALIDSGWSDAQIQVLPEWKVPKSPSEATKREGGQSFQGFPVDIAVFESEETAGLWEHVVMLFELKRPNKMEGRNQLEIYLGLEPRAKVGYWSNGTDSLTLYRQADGAFKSIENQPPPTPRDNLTLEAAKPLTWKDLRSVDTKTLRSVLRRLLDSIAANDTKTTRSDGRLNQLCNLLLVKLESDRHGKADPNKPVVFQPSDSESKTAKTIHDAFKDLRTTQPTLFESTSDNVIEFDDHTIQKAVYELAPLRLQDTSVEVVSEAFQVFRSANLKAGEGQYFTPHRLIQSAVDLMDVAQTDKVLDPACGTGGFLIEAFSSVQRRYPEMTEADLRTWAHRSLYGVDKDSINVKMTKAMMVILGDGSAHTHVGDSLRTHRWSTDYAWLTAEMADESFTCIITNPPFGKGLKLSASDARKAKYTITLAASKKANVHKDLELGLIFLERCYKLLQPGGRLGIVLPETYFFSSSYDWLWTWLEPRLQLRGMLNVPMEAFQGFCRAKTNFYVFEKLPEVADA